MMFNDVQLRTRRAVSLYKVYGNSTLLVIRTWLNSINALLTLNQQHCPIQWKLDIKRSDKTKYLIYNKIPFSSPNEFLSFVLYCLLITDITKYLI